MPYLLLILIPQKLRPAISKNPQIGKAYSEIHPDLKGKISSKHIIFYRELDNQTVEITRILHEKMDFKNKLG